MSGAVRAGWSRRDVLRLGGAAALVASGCGPPSPRYVPPPTTGPPPRRIRYGKADDQYAELYLPDRPDPKPVVVLIHGGFWGSQYGLELMKPLAHAFVSMGYAAWNVEYGRLGGAGGWPATFRDVGAGVDHLKVIARAHMLDLQHVVAVGHSAGGHLALWAGGRARIANGSELWVRWPRPLRGVVALAPVPDLRRAHGDGLDTVAHLMGGTPSAVPDHFAAGSPAEMLPLDVPQALIHGRDDRIVPLRWSEAYVAQARAKGDTTTLLALPGLGHFETIDPGSSAWPVVRQQVATLLS